MSSVSNENITVENQSLTFKSWKAFKDSQNKTGNPNFSGVKNILSIPVRNSGYVNNTSNSFNFQNNFNRHHDYAFNNRFNNSNVPYNFTNTNRSCGSKKQNFDEVDSYFTSDIMYTQKNILQRPLIVNNPFRSDQKTYELIQEHYTKYEKETSEINASNNDSLGCKDKIKHPLLVNKPFTNEQKADQLLKVFVKYRYTKQENKKSTEKPKQYNTSPNVFQAYSDDTMKLANNGIYIPKPNVAVQKTEITKVSEKQCKEPKVYVLNPKAKIDGKPYIPKPKLPEQNLQITKEEKKQQWKEYRQAMKPFKNREFYNAKRVVQRLGKKSHSELDEKQTIRLTKAREIMDAYKARLSAKHANYVKVGESSSELGEMYILKKTSLNDSEYGHSDAKQFQNYGNFGESHRCNDFESGRKIVGGYTAFNKFTPGGYLGKTEQSLDNYFKQFT